VTIKTKTDELDRRKVFEDIFDGALVYARQRLRHIEDDDVEDTMSFDRVARTALSLVRVASEIDALAARKIKETEDHARSGAVTPEDIDRHERELARRLERHARDLAERLAPGVEAARERHVEGDGE
jgi:hypothetical protein